MSGMEKPPRLQSGRRGIFVDRDGTLIYDRSYLSDPEQVTLLPGVAACLRRMKDRGFLVVLLSNQSGIGRGFFSLADLDAVHCRLVQKLETEGVRLDGVYHCIHGPEEGCDCRKPRPGLLWRAAAELGIDPRCSLMVGDKPSDIDAGRNAGCVTVLFGDNQDATVATDFACVDWADFREKLDDIEQAVRKRFA